MASPGLELTFDDIRAAIGDFCGLGRGPDAWEADEAARVLEYINSGLRQFYVIPHQWSFLKPKLVLTTTAEQADQDLPEDFGFMEGSLTYGTNEGYCSIEMTNDERIRVHRQRINSTGRPAMAAIRVKKSDGGGVQRMEILWYPTPDSAYTVTGRYRVHPRMLTADLPHPYGGPAHAETILQSCLAIAEQRLRREVGVQTQKYQQLLAQSIEYDRRAGSPDTIGYNLDPGEDVPTVRRVRGYVTYNGYPS